jgi:hypothetical protein
VEPIVTVPPSVSLVVALLCLVAWLVFGFVIPVGVGAIHLLLAIGVLLLIQWWAVTK